jgi:hypothetical protein
MMQVYTTEIFKRFWTSANSLELFLPKEENFIHNTNSYSAKFAKAVFRNFAGQQTSRSRSDSVGIVNTAWAGRCGVRIPVEKKRFFSSPKLPGGFWGPPKPLFSV